MVAELHAWADWTRYDRDAPAWAVEPIPVVDYVDVTPGRPALRVVGGATLTPPEWIKRRAAAMDACRMVRAWRDAECGRWTVAPSSCHVRTCPDCEAQRSSRAQAIYADVAAERMADPRFVTLTLLNVARGQLRAALRRLRRLVAQLLRRGLFAGGRCRYRRDCGAVRSYSKRTGRPRICNRPARDHVVRDDGTLALKHEWRSRCEALDPAGRGHSPTAGGIVSIEVTYNAESDTWHPHAHLLVDTGYIPARELRTAWLELTSRAGGEPAWRVHVERVTPKPGQSRRDGMAAAIRETVKYSTKPTPELVGAAGGAALAELLLALRGQRLVSAFGSLHGIPAAELDPDELDTAETVRVADPDDEFRAWRLPRLCPHVDDAGLAHEAAWTDPTWIGRAECHRVRAGPKRTALAWRGPDHPATPARGLTP